MECAWNCRVSNSGALVGFRSVSPPANEASLTRGVLSSKLSTHSSLANFTLKTRSSILGYCWVLGSKKCHALWGKQWREHQGPEPSREWMASHLPPPGEVNLQCPFFKPGSFPLSIQLFLQSNYFSPGNHTWLFVSCLSNLRKYLRHGMVSAVCLLHYINKSMYHSYSFLIREATPAHLYKNKYFLCT